MRRIFWMLFLGTPLLALATGALQPVIEPVLAGLPRIRVDFELTVSIVSIIGALGAGYFLGKTQTYGAGLVPLCVFHAVWILFSYAFIGAICSAMISLIY